MSLAKKNHQASSANNFPYQESGQSPDSQNSLVGCLLIHFSGQPPLYPLLLRFCPGKIQSALLSPEYPHISTHLLFPSSTRQYERTSRSTGSYLAQQIYGAYNFSFLNCGQVTDQRDRAGHTNSISSHPEPLCHIVNYHTKSLFSVTGRDLLQIDPRPGIYSSEGED